jgi:hydroxymethylbilane synthase
MPQSSSAPLRIGSRGSRLALVQAEMVRTALGHAEIVVVKTSGDRIQDRTLADAGGKGLFTKELEEALFENRIDLAVHSMKDVPAVLPKGLMIGALLPREDPRDALVAPNARTLSDLPRNARVGTSSVRRKAQLARARNDVQSLLLRGNVDTRLAKLDSGAFDAIILAVAGLKRLGLGERANAPLSPQEWLPSPAQGAIGLEIRADDARTRESVSPLDDEMTAVTLACERAFLASLDGSCRTPIAGLAKIADGMLRFHGEVLAPDGSDFVETRFESPCSDREDAARFGREAGLSLRPRAKLWLDV